MIRCPRCGRFASQTDDQEVKSVVKLLAMELKEGPRSIYDIKQALTARGEFVSSKLLSQAARYLELDPDEIGCVKLPPDDFTEILTPSDDEPIKTTSDSNHTVKTEPLSSPEFELNINSLDCEVVGAVRITNSCGACGLPLLDYEFTVRERGERGGFAVDERDSFGDQRRRHLLDTSADWFEELTPEEQQNTETTWESTHGLSLEVKHVGRVVRTDQRNDRTYYGFELTYAVTCKCGSYRFGGHFEGSVRAQEMRSLVTKSDMEDFYLESLITSAADAESAAQSDNDSDAGSPSNKR